MSLWVLDTDHISLALRGNLLVRQRMAQYSLQAVTNVINVITVQETFNGWVSELNLPNSGREKMLWQYHQLVLATELFGKVPVLEFDAAAYDCYVTLLDQNPTLRKNRLRNDMRIASIALANGATIVTRNRRDFELVPDLKIEDWSI
jgi:tRNA(fMet)-specific endonuclease VapC